MKKLIRHYSGKKSEKFWDKINKVKGEKRNLLYAIGCRLQDLEHIVLTKLEEYKELKNDK